MCDTKSYCVYTIWLSAEAIDLGRPYWILHPVSCHSPEAATTVFKCSWGWTQKASETCRVLLQLLINVLPSCITLVLYIYIYMENGVCMCRFLSYLKLTSRTAASIWSRNIQLCLFYHLRSSEIQGNSQLSDTFHKIGTLQWRKGTQHVTHI